MKPELKKLFIKLLVAWTTTAAVCLICSLTYKWIGFETRLNVIMMVILALILTTITVLERKDFTMKKTIIVSAIIAIIWFACEVIYAHNFFGM